MYMYMYIELYILCFLFAYCYNIIVLMSYCTYCGLLCLICANERVKK